uniref:Uncharacterized protein n=1 Tax=Arundo donax TaxID=35708 RepID=A0A0A9F1U5_ARUDO
MSDLNVQIIFGDLNVVEHVVCLGDTKPFIRVIIFRFGWRFRGVCSTVLFYFRVSLKNKSR